ncbi:MAG: hypothetical protein K6A69_10010 [Lachnospiraceae bacterium]|nr:hypothetical protein [Lachnospiraceae bacterium]
MDRWYNGIFLTGDWNEDGSLAHIVYGCVDTTDTKLQSLGAAVGTELVNNLISTADKALYESKESRDTFTILEK